WRADGQDARVLNIPGMWRPIECCEGRVVLFGHEVFEDRRVKRNSHSPFKRRERFVDHIVLGNHFPNDCLENRRQSQLASFMGSRNRQELRYMMATGMLDQILSSRQPSS